MDAAYRRFQKIEFLLNKILENQEEQKKQQTHLGQEIETVKSSVLTQEKKLEGIEKQTVSLQRLESGQEDITSRLIELEMSIKDCQKEIKKNIQSTAKDLSIILKHVQDIMTNRLQEIQVGLTNVCDQMKQIKSLDSNSTRETRTAHILKFTEAVKDCQKKTNTKIKQEWIKYSEKILGEINKSCNEIKQNHKTELRSTAGTLASDIISKCEVTVKDCQKEIEENIQSSTREISTLLKQQKDKTETFMTNRTQEIQVSLTKVCDQIKHLKEVDLKSTTETLTPHILKCTETVKDCQKETNTKIETNGKTLTDQIVRSKMEQFSFVEKECQIIRDRQQPRADMPVRTSYVFDFYIDNFISLIKSEQNVHSLPWHVDQLRSTVQGKVIFLSSGDMRVRLNYARHPREVGLEPRSGVRFKVTATITDTSGIIADLCVGEKTDRWDENDIRSNCGCGDHIGDVSCQKVRDLGFGSKGKNYERGAILVRFKVDIL